MTHRRAQAHDPLAEHGPLPRRPGGHRRRRLPRARRLLGRPRRAPTREEVRALGRARLHLPAARRHQPRLPQRPRAAGDGRRAGRRRRAPARALHPPDQHRPRGPAGGHARHHPHVPRQLPLLLGRPRGATTSSPRRCSASSTSTASSWSTTTTRSGGFEPLRFVPPGKPVVLGLVTTKRGALEDKDTLKRRIDEASQVRRRWSSSACHRSAASPPRSRATPSRRGAGGQAAPRRGDGGRGLGLGGSWGAPPSLCRGQKIRIERVSCEKPLPFPRKSG